MNIRDKINVEFINILNYNAYRFFIYDIINQKQYCEIIDNIARFRSDQIEKDKLLQEK